MRIKLTNRYGEVNGEVLREALDCAFHSGDGSAIFRIYTRNPYEFHNLLEHFNNSETLQRKYDARAFLDFRQSRFLGRSRLIRGIEVTLKTDE